MNEIDPAKVMTDHHQHDRPFQGPDDPVPYYWCAKCGWQGKTGGFTPWPCEPYCLASELTTLRAERDELREQIGTCQAEAWDKGFAEGVIDQERWHVTGEPNPGYRALNPFLDADQPSSDRPVETICAFSATMSMCTLPYGHEKQQMVDHWNPDQGFFNDNE